jgi:hypothetical protein
MGVIAMIYLFMMVLSRTLSLLSSLLQPTELRISVLWRRGR